MNYKRMTIVSLFLILLISISAQKVELKFEFNGANRTCKVYTPTDYDSTQTYPLLLAFHGMSRSADLMEYHSHLSEKAEQEKFIVAYPQMKNPSIGWEYKSLATNDLDFAMFLLDSLLAKYSINEKKVYATGFSSGAFLSSELAYKYSNRIAAIATVAGFEKETNITPFRTVPIMHFHAKNDPYVSYKNTKGFLNFWVEFNECTAAPDTILNVEGAVGEKWKSSKGCDVIFYSTDIGGHSWPGGESSWSPPSQAISATDLMWDFLKQYELAEITDVKEIENFNKDFTLEQNYPNPFNPSTTINYNLPERSQVTLKVYDILGNLITTLVNSEITAGHHSVIFNAAQVHKNLSSGVYFYTLETSKARLTKKLLLLK